VSWLKIPRTNSWHELLSSARAGLDPSVWRSSRQVSPIHNASRLRCLQISLHVCRRQFIIKTIQCSSKPSALLDKEYTKQDHNRSIFYEAITFDVRLLHKHAVTVTLLTLSGCFARQQVKLSLCPSTTTGSEDKAPCISNLDNRRRLTVNFWLPINLYCRERILGIHCLWGHMGPRISWTGRGKEASTITGNCTPIVQYRGTLLKWLRCQGPLVWA
jgi:hypothetical protein